MKALVLGLGTSGVSATKLLERMGAHVVGVDDRLCPRAVERIEEFDLFVPSPGISPDHPLYKRALEANLPIQGEVELFLQQTTAPCIGVTGTNGKTTTVKMIAHLLNASSKKAVAAGNVGVGLADVAQDAICVLELSSFQLETAFTKGLDVAVILNISENHLDRYPTFAAYREAKIGIERIVKSSGTLFVHEGIDRTLFSIPTSVLSGDNRSCAEQVCARFGVEDFSPLDRFVPPPHRLEFVAEIGGVNYINDSKATSVAATLHGLSQVSQEVVLILGGRDKGLSFAPLMSWKNRLSRVIVYGEAREKIGNQLQLLGNVYLVKTLQEAVKMAQSFATCGQVVLFSPGCASFDAFENYMARGEAFKEYVLRRDP